MSDIAKAAPTQVRSVLQVVPKITIYGHQRVIFMLPLVLLTPVLMGLHHFTGHVAFVQAWWALLILSVITTCMDFSRMASLLLLSVGVIAWFTLDKLDLVFGWSVLDFVLEKITKIKFSNLQDEPWLFAVIFSILLVADFVRARSNDVWIFGMSQIEHVMEGSKDDNIPRAGATISFLYEDMVKLVILGSGNIVIRAANGKVRTVKNVPFLLIRGSRIRRLFDSMPTSEVVAPSGE